MKRPAPRGRLVPLAPPNDPPRRWTDGALPPYRHVPGLTPHPVTDPRGHLHGQGEWLTMPPDLELPDDWRRCEPYLLGVDLFNRAYLWEAHEAWEVAWNASGHESAPGVFLQGLIQAAAALLQRHRGVSRGARTLGDKAADKLARTAALAGDGPYMGLPVDAWRRELSRALSGTGGLPTIELVGGAIRRVEP